ncbi:uncharacterized, partial [Tachysurus ichikawai]
LSEETFSREAVEKILSHRALLGGNKAKAMSCYSQAA